MNNTIINIENTGLTLIALSAVVILISGVSPKLKSSIQKEVSST
ncbi:MAG: hypothetical protein WBE34_16100 [Candidatus Nitrosopolaris sp.]